MPEGSEVRGGPFPILIEPPEGGLAESLYFEVRVGSPC